MNVENGTATDRIARTRAYRNGELVARDYRVADVSDHLAEPGTVVWVDLCAPDTSDLGRHRSPSSRSLPRIGPGGAAGPSRPAARARRSGFQKPAGLIEQEQGNELVALFVRSRFKRRGQEELPTVSRAADVLGVVVVVVDGDEIGCAHDAGY